jgi:type IV pilus assembly PilX-like protein
MKFKHKIESSTERGVALMVALLGLLLLAAIGTGLMFMANTENSINNNYRDSQRAFFAARAGAENVRVLLAPSGPLNAAAAALTMPSASANTGVIYVKNPAAGETVDPTTVSGAALADNPYLDTELCQEQFTGFPALTPTSGPCSGAMLMNSGTYFTAPTMSATDIPGTNGPNALLFKWVRITNKQNYMGMLNRTVDGTAANGLQVCWDGGKEVTIPSGQTCAAQIPVANPVWLLTSLAVTPKVGQNPGSRRMVQVEVASNPALIPPAPISTQAPVNLQGSFVLNAYDNCTCSCSTSGSGSHTTTTCGGAGCYNQAHAVYTANTVSVTGGSGQTTTNFGSDPTSGASVQNVNPWPYNIDDLITQYKVGAQSPGYSCSGTPNFFGVPTVFANCGTQSNQTFGTYPSGLPTEPSTVDAVTEYIPGSVKLTAGANGAGMLIVDGDLEINGGLNWYGLILVRGKVSFTGGAGQNVNLYGAILAGQDVSATDQAVTDVFGGSINFHYDVCSLKKVGGTRPPRLLATHELMF